MLKSLNRTEWLLPVGLAIFGFLSAYFHVSDVDVGYHMRTAEHILEGNGIPTTNTFSQTTPDQPWLLHQWLGALIFYLPYHAGGVHLLILCKALIVAVLVLLVWAAARRWSGCHSFWPLWTVTLGVMIARSRFFERPDLFSALFCAALVLLDSRWDRDRRWQWLGMPLLMMVWANVHAGVIYGMALLGAWIAGEWIAQAVRAISESRRGDITFIAATLGQTARPLAIRPLGFLLALAAAVASVQLINPNGAKVLWFPVAQFGSDFWQSIILEYRPPSWDAHRLFYLTLAGMGILQVLTFRRVEPRLLIASAGMAYLACTAQRSILFFVVVAMPHAASMLELALAGTRDRLRLCHRVLLPITWCGLVFFGFLADRTMVFGPGYFRPYYPLEIYRFLSEKVPSQNLFNEMRYGGSMLWWLHPQFKPFIDGRGDAYSIEFWESDYLPVIDVQPEWPAILARHDIRGVLLPIPMDRRVPRLAAALRNSPDWALVAFNDYTLLFLKRTNPNEELIARHEFRVIWPGDWSFAALDDPNLREAAAMEARRAVEFSPDCVYALTALARAFFVQERYDQAASLLEVLVNEFEVGENYFRDYGFALFQLERLDEADRVFNGMIRRQMLTGFASYMRYHIAIRQNRPGDARQHLSEAVRADPTNEEYRAAVQLMNATSPGP
jgi:hypothetical protein